MVLKPSEKSPLTALRLAELALEAGLPEGVFNVVPGFGHEAGEALALHMDVDAIGFTGSTRVGRKMLEYAGRSNLKRVYNELGGKSAFVVFPDFDDLDARRQDGGRQHVLQPGRKLQRALARARAREHRRRLRRRCVAAEAPKLPARPTRSTRSTVMGALVDDTPAAHRAGLHRGRPQRRRARCSPAAAQVRTETGGYFVEPTVFDGVSNSMKIAREEIFGPVLSVIRFKNEAEAVAHGQRLGLRPAGQRVERATSTAPTAWRARCGPAPCT